MPRKPSPPTRRTTLRLPPKMLRDLKIQAAREERTVTSLVLRAIREMLAKGKSA